ncbi:uncharacterized protein [Palaemon carinicauda]|uniref:uncharacterized protein n=1 Tax=Palaemon carinicauda TaxID=392227 RepID=UPI0035B5E406
MNSYQDTMSSRESYYWRLLIFSVLILYWNEVDGTVVQLREDSNFCSKNATANTISCNLEQQKGKLLKTEWKDWKFFTITNGSSLIILPQCAPKDKVLSISNTRDISTQPADQINVTSRENCQVGLLLLNSTAISLVDPLFSYINVNQSRIDAVNLIVDQFHLLEDSYVGNLDILATEKSTIKHSKVDSVTRIHIQGNQRLEIIQSSLNKVMKLIYNSSYNKESFIKETKVDKVYAHGLEMIQGRLTLDSVTFTDLSLHAIVIHGGSIHLRDVTIEKAYAKSIIMKGPGTITFTNVSIMDHSTRKTFQIKNLENQKLWPLAVVIGHNMSISRPAVITIGVLAGIFFIIILVVITMLFKYKKISCESMKRTFSYRNSENSPEVIQQTFSNVQNNSDLGEEDYTDVQTASPPSSSVLPVNNISESTDLNFSSVAAKSPVNPTTHRLQNIKDFDLQAPVDIYRDGHHFEVNDDEEPIYENCVDYIQPTHGTVPHDHHPVPVRNPPFLSNDKSSLGLKPNQEESFTAGQRRGPQSPQISEQIKAKSFLYNNKNPLVPAKPKITTEAPAVHPMKQTSKIPPKLPIRDLNNQFGRLQNPSSTLPVGDGYDDNYEDPEEIYECIP